MKTRRSGFTLIEILIIVVILGISVAIVAPRFKDAQEQRSGEIKAALEEKMRLQWKEYVGEDLMVASGGVTNRLNEEFTKLSELRDQAKRDVADCNKIVSNLKKVSMGGRDIQGSLDLIRGDLVLKSKKVEVIERRIAEISSIINTLQSLRDKFNTYLSSPTIEELTKESSLRMELALDVADIPGAQFSDLNEPDSHEGLYELGYHDPNSNQ